MHNMGNHIGVSMLPSLFRLRTCPPSALRLRLNQVDASLFDKSPKSLKSICEYIRRISLDDIYVSHAGDDTGLFLGYFQAEEYKYSRGHNILENDTRDQSKGLILRGYGRRKQCRQYEHIYYDDRARQDVSI